MKKYLQKKLNNEKGMTLIELLAVIVIIAIIAAIAIPAIGNIIDNSRVGASKSDALNAFAAAELYLAENEDAFTAAGAGSITADELTGGGYIKDFGSFTGTGATKPTFELVSGNLVISATAVNGGVTVGFTKTTKANVQALDNSDNTAAAVGSDEVPPATVTVTR
ncbi:prepilin-type N-terminal cleavage/methylation domain-containing protein [uncultured Planococcus sp.]|uniref:prepilin-type N-terminal cleavage/methylation domain-containing protein n=1 Tax=uncultured Planococcus sp. TaxID=337815 RepID=UPI00260D1F51|nr:prepilin-type N-terminal cleavage/methylation domain-containing protein [uncultured Planococcus sp.]